MICSFDDSAITRIRTENEEKMCHENYGSSLDHSVTKVNEIRIMQNGVDLDA